MQGYMRKDRIFMRAFEYFDEDGSGSMDLDELRPLLVRVGIDKLGITSEKVFDALNKPLDGSLTKEEFVAVMNVRGSLDTSFRELVLSTGAGKKKSQEDEDKSIKAYIDVATKTVQKVQVLALSFVAVAQQVGSKNNGLGSVFDLTLLDLSSWSPDFKVYGNSWALYFTFLFCLAFTIFWTFVGAIISGMPLFTTMLRLALDVSDIMWKGVCVGSFAARTQTHSLMHLRISLASEQRSLSTMSAFALSEGSLILF